MASPLQRHQVHTTAVPLFGTKFVGRRLGPPPGPLTGLPSLPDRPRKWKFPRPSPPPSPMSLPFSPPLPPLRPFPIPSLPPPPLPPSVPSPPPPFPPPPLPPSGPFPSAPSPSAPSPSAPSPSAPFPSAPSPSAPSPSAPSPLSPFRNFNYVRLLFSMLRSFECSSFVACVTSALLLCIDNCTDCKCDFGFCFARQPWFSRRVGVSLAASLAWLPGYDELGALKMTPARSPCVFDIESGLVARLCVAWFEKFNSAMAAL
ncbi:hypothetical protein H6P81_006857 [Aristolochia fimbriata]|uniref:Uncharacterized protein n=1 Tax=Aristolochia fimbriata TaxID=158543 RepID=A0AAV7EYR7_ARIFI|nr:hypothetical protein H6P81_006857 [Aristolochia fimbriata]